MRENTRVRMDKVSRYLSQGFTKTEALKKAKVAPSVFHKNKDAYAKLSAKPAKLSKPVAKQTVVIPEPVQSKKLIAIVGDASEVAKFLEQYHG